MTADIFSKVIDDNGLYFRRIDGYKTIDATEGDRQIFGEREKKILSSLNSLYPPHAQMSESAAIAKLTQVMRNGKRDVFIQSWYRDTMPSDDMWHDFAKFHHNPNCVMFTCNFLSLGAAIDHVLPVGFTDKSIQYIPDKSATNDAVFTKLLKFYVEKEYRAAINISELIFYNRNILPEFSWIPRNHIISCSPHPGEFFKNNGIADSEHFKYVDEYGFILKLPLRRLINEVYVPAQSSPAFREELSNTLRSKGFNIKVTSLNVKPRPENYYT